MQAAPSDWFRLHAGAEVEQGELVAMCHLSVDEIEELVDYGALAPLPGRFPVRVFSAACVPPLRQALRLRQDFDLDLFTVGLLLGYLQRIDALEQEVAALQARLPRHLQAAREGPSPWHEPHAGRHPLE